MTMSRYKPRSFLHVPAYTRFYGRPTDMLLSIHGQLDNPSIMNICISYDRQKLPWLP